MLEIHMLTGSSATHNYLSSLCGISDYTVTSTRLQSSTSLIAADTTTLATEIALKSAAANFTSGAIGDPTTSANTTSFATTSVAVIIPSVVSISGDGAERKVVRRDGAAQWALVVVVFARSLMY